MIEGILERRPSVRLIPAMLGRLGLELAREHLPHLILLDLRLPDLSGEQVLPVAIFSADATRYRVQFLAAGTQAYLTKPIDLRRLLEIFDQFLAVERERVPVSAE